jgi:hypothetical protein
MGVDLFRDRPVGPGRKHHAATRIFLIPKVFDTESWGLLFWRIFNIQK